MANERKTEFWWASVAGADCEPVEVTVLDGERVAYTCGCADPFYLDRPDCLVALVPIEKRYDGNLRKYVPLEQPLERPLTPAQETAKAAAYERKLKADAKRGIHHGWRGPR